MSLIATALFSLVAQGAAQAPAAPVVPVTDNLIVEGVPPIPRTIAERVGRYTEFRSARFLDWRPGSREMIVSTRFGNVAQVHHVRMPGGSRRQLTFFPERVSGAEFHPTDPNTFVFTKDVGGNENFQLYRYDLANGDTTLLTDGKSRNESPTWSPDGRFILYVSSRRNGADNDFYTVDPRDPKTDRRVRENKGGGWYPIDVSPDGRRAIVIDYRSVTDSTLHLLDLTSGQTQPMLPPPTSGTVAYGEARFGPRGIYYVSDEGSEFATLRFLPNGSQRGYAISDGKWDVEAFDLAPNRDALAYVQNENGLGVLYVKENAWNAKALPRRIASVPVGVVSGVKWSPDGRELAFTFDSSAGVDAYSVQANGRGFTRWTESETAGFDAARFAEAQLVQWKSFDGRMISGFLYMPPRATGRVPVMIDIHGGPEGQERPGFLGRYNYYLNELGIAVLFPNVRGSTGFGKTFVSLDNGFKREDSYKDIGALFDWIAAQPNLDPQRVMVTGGSYGGHMSFAISYLYADRIAAALPVVGMSNLVTFLENTAPYRRDLRRVEYGDERDPAMREFLLRIAPMNHAEKITKPIFVVQGVNDPRVPYSEATQFVERIKTLGGNKNVWFLAAKDEGHGFAKKSNADFQMYATVMFIERFLLNRP